MRITQKIFLLVSGAILSIGVVALLLVYYFLGSFFEGLEREQVELIHPRLEHLFAAVSKTEAKVLSNSLTKEYLFLREFTINKLRRQYKNFYQRHLNQSDELQALIYFPQNKRSTFELWDKNLSFTKKHIDVEETREFLSNLKNRKTCFIPLLSKENIEEGFALAYYDDMNRAWGIAVFKKSIKSELLSSFAFEKKSGVVNYLCTADGDVLAATINRVKSSEIKSLFMEKKREMGRDSFFILFDGKTRETITRVKLPYSELYLYKQMIYTEKTILDEFKMFGEKYLSKVMYSLIGVMFVGLLLFFFILWKIANVVASPLEEVTEFSNKLAHGKYDVSFTPKYTSKEIDLLLKSLHFMRDQMQRSIIKLETSHSREVQAREEAEQANIVRSNFLVNMSRELRTPLNSILGLSQIIKKEITRGKYDEKLNKKIEAIRKSAVQLNTLITGLLKLGDAADETEALDIIDFMTSEFLIDLTTTVNQLAEKKNVSVTCNYSSTMPQRLITDYKVLKGIMNDLATILLNIASKDGEIHLGCTYDSRWVSFWIELVQKDGTNISLAKKFNEYINDSKELLPEFYNNDLLSLTVAQANTVLLGGEFIAESPEHVDSRFSVNLRSDSVGMLIDTATQAFHSASNAQKQAIELLNSSSFKRDEIVVEEDSIGTITVLSAEDNLENQMLIEMMLKDTEFKLIKAKDGEECLSILSEHEVQLLLLDMQMPKIDGIAVLAELQKDEKLKKIPVIILTAHLDSKIKTYLDSVDVKGCYVKPIDVEGLLNTMRKATQ
jgi:CheY-like chemotaxis protein/signal transduction histidine kinase